MQDDAWDGIRREYRMQKTEGLLHQTGRDSDIKITQ